MRNLLPLVLVTICSATHADSDRLNIPDLYETEAKTEAYEWRGFNMQMSNREYRQVTRHNQGLVVKAVSNYVEGKFLSLGIPQKGIDLTGAAVGFVVYDGAKLNLNKSKTMAFEVKDVINQKPALMFKVNLDW